MTWFKTINHRGEEVEIGSIDAMNAVVDAYEMRLDQLALLLEGKDRDARRRAVSEYRLIKSRFERIEADTGKADAHAELESEDRFHRDLAQAIKTRKKP